MTTLLRSHIHDGNSENILTREKPAVFPDFDSFNG